MNYKDVVKEFVARTRVNLENIESQAREGSHVFETTQLINSMLGLLIFPEQHYIDHIKKIPLDQLEQEGWPKIQVTDTILKSPDYRECKNLRDLVVYLRNAIAHCNIKFLSDGNGNINRLRLWNVNTRDSRKPITWDTILSIEDLRVITNKFIETFEGEQGIKPKRIEPPDEEDL